MSRRPGVAMNYLFYGSRVIVLSLGAQLQALIMAVFRKLACVSWGSPETLKIRPTLHTH